jgi:magnesium chelatase subunit I
VAQERSHFAIPGIDVVVPEFMQDIITGISHQARRSNVVSQRSGVSVRMSVANTEVMIANAGRRALRTGETIAVPRISDLEAIHPSSMGKIEFETFGEGRDEDAFERIVGDAIKTVFRERVNMDGLTPLLTAFDNGLTVHVSDNADAYSYIHQVSSVGSLGSAISDLTTSNSPQEAASAIEFVLEGLHQMRKVSRRSRPGSGTRYSL